MTSFVIAYVGLIWDKQTTHVHKTFWEKNVVHKHVVHKAFLDPKTGGHNVIESANTVVCESDKAFPRGV